MLIIVLCYNQLPVKSHYRKNNMEKLCLYKFVILFVFVNGKTIIITCKLYT